MASLMLICVQSAGTVHEMPCAAQLIACGLWALDARAFEVVPVKKRSGVAAKEKRTNMHVTKHTQVRKRLKRVGDEKESCVCNHKKTLSVMEDEAILYFQLQ